MKITIVVAIAENGMIGCANKLLWHIREDLKHFKRITTGGCVVMGRKTFESIGKALPNRRNVIISRNIEFKAEGCDIYSSLEEAFMSLSSLSEIFIIGGGEIYRQVLPIADKIELTVIEKVFDGDTCFPEIEYSEWDITNIERYDEGELPFRFETLLRK